MKVLLIDVDSKIPNLALMKISAYHKSVGDTVGFNVSNPDIVFASIVFSKNGWKGNGIKKIYKNSKVFIGGSGYDLESELPDHIEKLKPDYDLYPDMNYSIGFTSRGCIRKCEFCIVWKKEGFFKPIGDIYDFWNEKHNHLVILDNNILADKDHFFKISEQIINEGLTVDFNQGLDIRLVDDEIAVILKELNVKPDYRFAWDNVNDEKKIINGINILKGFGIKRSLFYVLVGFNSSYEDDLYRLNRLKELDQRAYVMRYRKNRFYNDLSAWANQRI